jgi:hypothetical protein
MPYFDGDFWPGVIEQCVEEMKDGVVGNISGTGKKGSKKRASKKGAKSSSKAFHQSNCGDGDELMDRLMGAMEKHRDVFFVVQLSPNAATSQDKIREDDADIICELMDGRDQLLQLCREGNHEFKSLRRAKHTSMVMLYNLHNSENNDFSYTCNNCQGTIGSMDIRYHCANTTECPDFDLCEKCYKTTGHPHPMDKLGLMQGGECGVRGAGGRVDRREAMRNCLLSLQHTSVCSNMQCTELNCAKMKQVLLHFRSCQHGPASCNICRQLTMLCRYHALSCTAGKCSVPHCEQIKRRIQEQRNQQLAKSRAMQARRMAMMNGGAAPLPQPQAAATGGSGTLGAPPPSPAVSTASAATASARGMSGILAYPASSISPSTALLPSPALPPQTSAVPSSLSLSSMAPYSSGMPTTSGAGALGTGTGAAGGGVVGAGGAGGIVGGGGGGGGGAPQTLATQAHQSKQHQILMCLDANQQDQLRRATMNQQINLKRQTELSSKPNLTDEEKVEFERVTSAISYYLGVRQSLVQQAQRLYENRRNFLASRPPLTPAERQQAHAMALRLRSIVDPTAKRAAADSLSQSERQLLQIYRFMESEAVATQAAKQQQQQQQQQQMQQIQQIQQQQQQQQLQMQQQLQLQQQPQQLSSAATSLSSIADNL